MDSTSFKATFFILLLTPFVKKLIFDRCVASDIAFHLRSLVTAVASDPSVFFLLIVTEPVLSLLQSMLSFLVATYVLSSCPYSVLPL